jgi:hypothetical protein
LAFDDRYPVGRPPNPNLCSGVVGLRRPRDRALPDDWAWLVREAGRDPEVRSGLACWDQGALIWAMTRHGLPVADVPHWNHPGRRPEDFRHRFPSPGAVFDRLGPPPAVLTHFQARPKPDGWGAPLDVELTIPDMQVFVLGHRTDKLAQVAVRPFLHPFDLNDTGLPNSWGEARMFLALTDAQLAALPEYVGFATNQWDRKYGPRALPLAELHRAGPLLRPDRVVCAEHASANWPLWTAAQNPGLLPYVAVLRG